jgi:predicted amidohydrolase YtcJ
MKGINDMDKKSFADLVVYGKIFTSDNNQIVEAFAVKDGKYVYVGDKKGAGAYIEAGKTQVVDYTGKGLVMPSCGNGHAHYSIGVALPIVGTIAIGATPDQFLNELVPAGMEDKSYPMKSYFDNGIPVTSHSDFPALSGCPDDPFGIMEIAVTCVHPTVKGDPWWPEEHLTRGQALASLTINIAKQMFIEKERRFFP